MELRTGGMRMGAVHVAPVNCVAVVKNLTVSEESHGAPATLDGGSDVDSSNR